MNGALLYVLLGSAACGCVLAAWPAPAPTGTPRAWPSVIGLIAVIGGLLAVGLVSGTPLRHVVQVTPAALALLVVWRGAPGGRAAALPILTFWLGLMVTIWLFLIDLVRLVSGHFTPTEIVLTIAIGCGCAAGLAGGPRPTAGLSTLRRVFVAVFFAVAQIAALVLSMQPPIVSR